jgi:hypothetical protein
LFDALTSNVHNLIRGLPIGPAQGSQIRRRLFKIRFNQGGRQFARKEQVVGRFYSKGGMDLKYILFLLFAARLFFLVDIEIHSTSLLQQVDLKCLSLLVIAFIQGSILNELCQEISQFLKGHTASDRRTIAGIIVACCRSSYTSSRWSRSRRWIGERRRCHGRRVRIGRYRTTVIGSSSQ